MRRFFAEEITDKACAPNPPIFLYPSTYKKLWKDILFKKHFHKCQPTGVVKSPNYPNYYPRNIEKTETIQVESGKILRLQFTDFQVYISGSVSNCTGDHVLVTDWDGTVLMDKSCGFSTYSSTHSYYFKPPVLLTNTNAVRVYFRNFGGYTHRGWSLNWGAMQPGLKRQHENTRA